MHGLSASLSRMIFAAALVIACGPVLSISAQDAPDLRARVREIETVATQGPFAPSLGLARSATRCPIGTRTRSSASSSTGASTRSRRSGTSGIRGTCTSRDTPEFEHHVATYGPQSKFGYKDFIPQFKAEQFDAAPGRRCSRRPARGTSCPSRNTTTASRCTTAAHRVERGEDGAEARRHRRAGEGRARRRASCSASRPIAPSTGGSSTRARRSTPTCAIRSYAGFYGPARSTRRRPRAQTTAQTRPTSTTGWRAPRSSWTSTSRSSSGSTGGSRSRRSGRTCSSSPPSTTTAAREWGQGVAINYKKHGGESFPDTAGVLDIERGQLAAIRPHFWQTDTSVSKNSWGYVENQEYKTADSIVDDLVDIVSKNGALLLNIGPRPDGTIPEPEDEILRAIGGWLRVNGEAIYGTRPWTVFGEGPTAGRRRVVRRHQAQAVHGGTTSASRRKGPVLYAIGWPGPPTTWCTSRRSRPHPRSCPATSHRSSCWAGRRCGGGATRTVSTSSCRVRHHRRRPRSRSESGCASPEARGEARSARLQAGLSTCCAELEPVRAHDGGPENLIPELLLIYLRGREHPSEEHLRKEPGRLYWRQRSRAYFRMALLNRVADRIRSRRGIDDGVGGAHLREHVHVGVADERLAVARAQSTARPLKFTWRVYIALISMASTHAACASRRRPIALPTG